jgi:hypothetical protein
MAAISVTIKEDAIRERIAQKIADYWNGRTVKVSGGVGSEWSDWYGVNWGQERRRSLSCSGNTRPNNGNNRNYPSNS